MNERDSLYVFVDDYNDPLTPKQRKEAEKHWFYTVLPLLEDSKEPWTLQSILSLKGFRQ